MTHSLPGFPAPAPSFDEPLDMLEACHGRIEAQLATLERLVTHLCAHGCDDSAREAARAVMRYFDTAAEHHHRDEEEDLFPALRRHALGAREDVMASLDDLEREHAGMSQAYGALREQLRAIAEDGAARLDIEQVGRFAWRYRSHIAHEEEVVLPYARQALRAAEQAEMGARMAARRGAAPARMQGNQTKKQGSPP
jgi:hemerythrin-like domain-containing protein